MAKANVEQPLLTRFAVINALVPVRLGQKQLIIGNKGTGKTTLVLNIIKNQKRNNRFFSPESRGRDKIFCVYVAIGLRLQKVKSFLHELRKVRCDWYTALIDGSSARPFAQQYLTPFAACTYGEIYKDNGLNSLVVYDDLDKHTNAYREANLLIRNPSGREAYPGDIFYIHTRLLERAAQFSKYYGYRSLTALPVVKIKRDNLNTYIPTNLISITDGQWFLRTDYSKKGLYPALDIEKSVSKIRRKAQSALMS